MLVVWNPASQIYMSSSWASIEIYFYFWCIYLHKACKTRLRRYRCACTNRNSVSNSQREKALLKMIQKCFTFFLNHWIHLGQYKEKTNESVLWASKNQHQAKIEKYFPLSPTAVCSLKFLNVFLSKHYPTVILVYINSCHFFLNAYKILFSLYSLKHLYWIILG